MKEPIPTARITSMDGSYGVCSGVATATSPRRVLVVLPDQYWSVPDEAVPGLRHCARIMIAIDDRDGTVRRDNGLRTPKQFSESADEPYHALKRPEKVEIV